MRSPQQKVLGKPSHMYLGQLQRVVTLKATEKKAISISTSNHKNSQAGQRSKKPKNHLPLGVVELYFYQSQQWLDQAIKNMQEETILARLKGLNNSFPSFL